MARVLAGGRVVRTVAADVLGRLARVAHSLLLLAAGLGAVGRDVAALATDVTLPDGRPARVSAPLRRPGLRNHSLIVLNVVTTN